MKWVLVVIWVATGQVDASFVFTTEVACRRAHATVMLEHSPMVRARCVELREQIDEPTL